MGAVALSAFAVVLSVGSSSAATAPSLAAIVLSPSQVGPGYHSKLVQDGREVQGQATLDLCGFSYASEALRTARIQMLYMKSTSAPTISNEVVSYRLGGTQEAIDELNHAIAHCPTKPVNGPTAGEQNITWRVARIAAPHLPAGAVAVRISASGVVAGKRDAAMGFAIYQTHADILSGVYGYGTDTQAVEKLTLHAAQASAAKLT